MNDNEFWFSVILLVGVVFLIRSITSAVMAAVKSHHEGRLYWGKTPDSVPPHVPENDRQGHGRTR